MASFNDDERRMLSSVLPGVAAALRPPLNNLNIAAQRLMEQCGGDQMESAVLRQSYYRMLRLVGNLDMGPELLSDTPFAVQNEDLVPLLDELCRQADSAAHEAGVAVHFVCRERYVIAAVHREYLMRLVWNLLSNALKATPKGGIITVTLEVKNRHVLLRVQDTGCGIPQQKLASLFDQWAHTPQPGCGMGLGLPICRRIAEGHGGRLLLESREGQGTLVTAALPHVRRNEGQVRDCLCDYAGGFSHVMLELSDALPCAAFYEKHMD